MDPDTQPPASPDTPLELEVDITYASSSGHYSVPILETDGTELDRFRARFTIGKDTPHGRVVTIYIHETGAPDDGNDVDINLGVVRFKPCTFSPTTYGDDGSKKRPTEEQVMAAALTQYCTVKIVDDSGEYEIVVASPMLEDEIAETLEEDEAEKIFGDR